MNISKSFQTIKLAWRNIWRQTRRTLITAGGIGVGLMMMFMSIGMMQGFSIYMMEVATGSFLGDAQIHSPKYLEHKESEFVIPEPKRMLEKIHKSWGVKAATPRLFASGLLAIGDRNAGVEVVGYDIENEAKITRWNERLIAGELIQGDERGNVGLIGKGLAEKLEIEEGSRVVLSVADATTGEINSLLVRIRGILGTGDAFLDRSAILLPIEKVQALLGLPGAIHQVTLKLDAPSQAQEDLEPIVKHLERLLGEKVKVETWLQRMPMAAKMIEMQETMFVPMVLIIFFIIALGIMNTFAMSLQERMFEFGVLRALGTTPFGLAGLILWEALFLGIIGTAVGFVLGYSLHLGFATYGWPLQSMEFGGVIFDQRVYSNMDWGQASLAMLLFVVLTTLTGLFSAWKAARIKPSEALRKIA